MSTSIPALTSVNDILDTDLMVVTHSAGASEKMTGADLKKNFDIIIASGTTVSGPGLHAGSTVRIYFSSAITALNASTALVINYNNMNVTVKAPKDGSLIDYVAKAVGNDFIYCQAHTTLELLYNGTNFVIIGNPVVVSNSDYTIYADGLKAYNSEISNFSHNAISGSIAYKNGYYKTWSEVTLTRVGESSNYVGTFTFPSPFQELGYNVSVALYSQNASVWATVNIADKQLTSVKVYAHDLGDVPTKCIIMVEGY
jgi:hypothetical protein